MKRLTIITILCIVTSMAFASSHTKTDTTKKTQESKVFTAIDVVPEFPGGIAGFSKFILKNLKYPEVASLTGLNGKV